MSMQQANVKFFSSLPPKIHSPTNTTFAFIFAFSFIYNLMLGKALFGALGTTLVSIYVFLIRIFRPILPSLLPSLSIYQPTEHPMKKETIEPPLLKYGANSDSQEQPPPPQIEQQVSETTAHSFQSTQPQTESHESETTAHSSQSTQPQSQQQQQQQQQQPFTTSSQQTSNLQPTPPTVQENFLVLDEKQKDLQAKEEKLIEKEEQLKLKEKLLNEQEQSLTQYNKELKLKEQQLVEKEKTLVQRENDLKVQEKLLKERGEKLLNLSTTSTISTIHRDRSAVLKDLFNTNFRTLILSIILEGIFLLSLSLCWRKQRNDNALKVQHQHKMIEHLENGVRTSIKVFNTIADLLLECRDALSNFVQYKDFVAEIDVSLNELRRLTEEAEIRLNLRNATKKQNPENPPKREKNKSTVSTDTKSDLSHSDVKSALQLSQNTLTSTSK